MAIEQAMTRMESRTVANRNETRLPALVRLDDADIAAAIADVLSWNRLPADTVWATVVAGRVTLEGEVERWSQRDTIERAVSCVTGVRGLKNMLTVRPEAISRELERSIVEARSSPW
jgi:osmotically-inducible protein OsmY